MAMQDEWVNAIFMKLSLVYGVRFKAMYTGVDVTQVRSDWAHELDGISGEQLNHALKNLPADFPPNVLQFKALCQEQRPEPMRALIAPPRTRMSPKVRQQLAVLLDSMRSTAQDPLAGARSLRDKERNGILLTRAQREFWRQALAREMREESSDA